VSSALLLAILIGLLIVLPLMGAQLGIDLDVVPRHFDKRHYRGHTSYHR